MFVFENVTVKVANNFRLNWYLFLAMSA